MSGVGPVVPEKVTLSPINPGPALPDQLGLVVHSLSDPRPSHVAELTMMVSGVMT